MPFPDRDQVRFPLEFAPALDESPLIVPGIQPHSFVEGSYNPETLQDSGHVSTTCCGTFCCGTLCEIGLGDITWSYDATAVTRPSYHPDGGAEHVIAVAETYSFVPWANLDGLASNLSDNEYTAYKVFGADCISCTVYFVFAPVLSPQDTYSVTIWTGGDTSDLANYSTGDVTVQSGLARGVGPPDQILFDVVAWDISELGSTIETDWGTYEWEDQFIGVAAVGGATCGWAAVTTDSADLATPGVPSIYHCASSTLSADQRLAAGFPKIPQTIVVNSYY